MADWTCPTCNWDNRGFSEVCMSCGAARDQADSAVQPSADSAVSPGADSAAPWGTPMFGTPDGAPVALPAAPALPLGAGGLAGGLVAAAVAAVLATGIWYAVVANTEYQIAFVAIAVGWLVGTAAVFGAGQRGSILLAAASVLFTFGALVVSEYLIVYHFATQAFGSVDLIQPLDFMIEVVAESLSAEPATLLFWGIALVAAGYIPIQKMRHPSPEATPETVI